MELSQYLKILKKEQLSIILIVAFALLIGFFYSLKAAPGYKIEQTFLIEATTSALPGTSANSLSQLRSPQDEARNFTDTAVALLKSKDLMDNQSPTSVTAEKVAPQLIKLTVSAQNPTEATMQMEKTAVVFNQKIKELIKAEAVSLKAIGPTPVASLNKIDSKIILGLSFFAGLTFALLAVSLKTYFKL